MTERLYQSDPYKTSFQGTVVRRLETSEGPAVVLETTYFYPESGGQPHDCGTIDGIRVRRVEERGRDIIHVLERQVAHDRVTCVIDARRRRDHMQQHSGQHILSAAFLKVANAQTLSFHLGTTSCTIDLGREVSREDLASAEREANRTVRAAVPIRGYSVTPDEAASLELRKSPQAEGVLRIVEVEGFDRQACCGTHPANSAEVGPILIRGAERLKKGARVEFLCGDRAIDDYHRLVANVRSMAQTLSAPEEALVEVATRLLREKKSLGKELQAMREEKLGHDVARWRKDGVRVGEKTVVVRELAGATPGELRLAANLLTDRPGCVALLGCRSEGRAHLVFARSSELTTDVAALLRTAVRRVNGKGGGSSQIAQGGGPGVEGLADALELARSTIGD